MKIFESEFSKYNNRKTVLAFGNFDGVHKGHLHLLECARDYAEKNDCDFGVYTFIDSPKFRLASHSLLTDLQGRISAIGHKASPDFLYLEQFDDVRDFSPKEFVDYITGKFDCVCAFCGENFRFGRSASGNSGDLQNLMRNKGNLAFVVDNVYDNGELISSTLIKSLLSVGDVFRASKLLGNPFGFTSRVVHGAHLGHKLGFPTINQILPELLVCPEYGVYSTIVLIDGKEYTGVTNFGVKPTVSADNKPVAETFIIDFNEDLYNKMVGIYFCKKLRGEKKFSSLDELKESIARDVELTKMFFEEKYEKM